MQIDFYYLRRIILNSFAVLEVLLLRKDDVIRSSNSPHDISKLEKKIVIYRFFYTFLMKIFYRFVICFFNQQHLLAMPTNKVTYNRTKNTLKTDPEQFYKNARLFLLQIQAQYIAQRKKRD